MPPEASARLRDPQEREAQAWQERRDEKSVKIDWRFGKEDARIKLKRLYPSLQE
jgi:hypothetical protein